MAGASEEGLRSAATGEDVVAGPAVESRQVLVGEHARRFVDSDPVVTTRSDDLDVAEACPAEAEVGRAVAVTVDLEDRRVA